MHILFIILTLLAILLTGVTIVKKPSTVYKNMLAEQNPMEGKKVRFVDSLEREPNADGVRGYLEVVGEAHDCRSVYDRIWKRIVDIVLSFFGLVILSPIYLMLSIAIVIDDPGPVFFVQKRVGRNKQYFKLHKFRSMKMLTPHDVPTHMLERPEQYITRVGRFLRKSSLDELPQIWDIFVGNMSIIGPRPALWNQDLLIAERDKWEANGIRPGLTGWAQINGRDEIEIPVKAMLDGEYVKRENFFFDCRCFVETIISIVKGDGIVEGGVGAINKRESID